MNLVITDSGLGGLSICAQLMRLIKERAKSTLPQLPVDDLHITYVNAVPADERGYNFMSGRAEQLETFEKILLLLASGGDINYQIPITFKFIFRLGLLTVFVCSARQQNFYIRFQNIMPQKKKRALCGMIRKLESNGLLRILFSPKRIKATPH